MGHAAQPQLGLHQGEAGTRLQEARGILAIQLGLEDHLAQGRLQLNLFNLTDVDPAVADRAADSESRVAVGHQGECPYLGLGLLLAVKQLVTAAACAEPIEFDGAAQQGGEVPHLDLHAIHPYPGIQRRFFPELRLLLQQGA